MKYLALPPSVTAQPLPFYLTMEEHAMGVLERADCDALYFMWQVPPTVIIGRNQELATEVNLDYCRAHGIAVYRRKSGGGCVFADSSNIMLSYITRGDNVSEVYSRYTSAIVSMLRSLGLNATATGRNDIMIDGGKVSGSAFYSHGGYSIVHGTMLYDTDMSHMSHAITPSRAKLQSKGVTSVTSRVTTLSRHLDMGIDAFKEHARRALCDGTIMLTDSDVAAIEHRMEEYLSPAFIAGRGARRASGPSASRIGDAGEVAIDAEITGDGTLGDITMRGDFFQIGNLDEILTALRGVKPDREALTAALVGTDMSNVIYGLNTSQFIDMIINQTNINQ